MIVLSVLYPASEQARFDRAYYDATHIPLVKAAFGDSGLASVQVLYGVGAPGGGPAPYVAMAHLSFDSPEALKASMQGPRAGEVMADIANFTDIAPVMQLSQPG